MLQNENLKLLTTEAFFENLLTEKLVVEGLEDLDEIDKLLNEKHQVISKTFDLMNAISLNRYLPYTLVSLELDEILNLFETLEGLNFTIKENFTNYLYSSEYLLNIMQEKYNINELHDIAPIYIKSLLEGHDILDDVVDKEVDPYEGEDYDITLRDVLVYFEVSTESMMLGDAPNIPLLLNIQKRLIAIKLADLNLNELLDNEKKEKNLFILNDWL